MSQLEIVFGIVQALVGSLAGLLGWNLRTMKAELREGVVRNNEINADLQAYKLHVAETYVKNQDLDRLEGKIDKLFEKLDTKVDK